MRLTRAIMLALKKKVTDDRIDLATCKTQFILREPDHKEQFKEAQSVDDLLMVMFENCSFTNPDTLESLAVEFDLPEIEKEVEKYRVDLGDYFDRVLAEDFTKKGLDEYDKSVNIEVSMSYTDVKNRGKSYANY